MVGTVTADMAATVGMGDTVEARAMGRGVSQLMQCPPPTALGRV